MNSMTMQSGVRGLWLLGSVVLMALMFPILGVLGIDGQEISEGVTTVLFMILFGLPAYLWGQAMAKLHGLQPAGRYGWAAGLAFGVLIGGSVLYLNHIERRIQIFMLRTDLEIHQLFMVVFVTVAAVAAFGTGLALGLAGGDLRQGLRLGLWGGLAAGLAFFLTALFMDVVLGFQVGAPGAELRFTMVTVTILGIVAAAVAGSAAVGRALAESGKPEMAG